MALTEYEQEVVREFGRYLRSESQAAGWDIEELAEAAKLDVSFLREVEAGEDQIKLLSMNSVAKVLNVDLLAFLPYRRKRPRGRPESKT